MASPPEASDYIESLDHRVGDFQLEIIDWSRKKCVFRSAFLPAFAEIQDNSAVLARFGRASRRYAPGQILLVCPLEQACRDGVA